MIFRGVTSVDLAGNREKTNIKTRTTSKIAELYCTGRWWSPKMLTQSQQMLLFDADLPVRMCELQSPCTFTKL